MSPVGIGAEATWEALKAGRSGIGPITLFDASEYPTRIAGEVKGFAPEDFMDRREARRMDRFVQFAVAATQMALEDAGFVVDPSNANEVGVMIGSGVGGIRTWEEQHEVLITKGPDRVSPFLIPMMIGDMAAGHVSILTGAKGPNSGVVTACASGSHSIGFAADVIRSGEAVAMIAGGAEAAVAPCAVAGFSNMRALSRRNRDPEGASRPFDRGRDGFVIAEGAGIVLLESLSHARERGARIYAEFLSMGMSADACHVTAMAPDGDGAVRAMDRALRRAGVPVDEVDYINAHGTSTDLNDRTETLAIKKVFGEAASKIAVSSTKSMVGHLLGASGAVELIACVLAIRDNVLPPTINHEDPDPECDLDYVPNVSRPAQVDTALSNSFGFGGHNACLLVRRFQE